MHPQKAPSGYEIANVQQYTPETLNLYNKLLSSVSGSYLPSGIGKLGKLAAGDEAAFSQVEKPYYSALQKALGQSAGRFSQYGTGAFQQAQAGAGQSLRENLAAQRQQISMNALQSLLGLSQSIFSNQPYENVLVPEKERSSWLPVIAGALTGAGIRGPAGAYTGATVGAHFAGSRV